MVVIMAPEMKGLLTVRLARTSPSGISPAPIGARKCTTDGYAVSHDQKPAMRKEKRYLPDSYLNT